MTKKKNEDSNNASKLKDVYRLWVEYLRESGEYKYRCETSGNSLKEFLSEKKEILERGTRKLNPFKVKDNPIPSEKERYEALCKINPVFKEMSVWDAMARYWKRWNKHMRFFGNIHAEDYDFDKWWEEYACEELERRARNIRPITELNHEHIALYAGDLHEYLDEVWNKRGDSFTAEDIIKHFVEWNGESEDKLTLVISTYCPTNDLINAFSKLLAKHKKKYRIDAEEEKKWKNHYLPMPIAGRLSSELQTYLDVYRQKSKNIPWKEVIKQIAPQYLGPHMDFNDVKRKFQLYQQKAKKIINNVENGLFPGPY